MILVGGISGVGKTTLCNKAGLILQRQGFKVRKCIPFTTRPIRSNEVDGQDYRFVSSEEVMELVSDQSKEWDVEELGGYIYANSKAETIPQQNEITLIPIHPHSLADMRETYSTRVQIRSVFIVITDDVIDKWIETYTKLKRSKHRPASAQLAIQKVVTNYGFQGWDYVFKPRWTLDDDLIKFVDLLDEIIQDSHLQKWETK